MKKEEAPSMMELTTKAPSSHTSRFLKTVVLKDWWLIRTVDKEEGFQSKLNLGVAGFTPRYQKQAVRGFTSAPILKTYSVFTLETVDGVTVKLEGFINKLRTKENGFPDEVFDHFVFGFPPFWEDYMGRFFESGQEGTPNRNINDINKSEGKNMGSSPADKGISDEKSRLLNTNIALVGKSDFVAGVGDIREGTPNRNRKAMSKKKRKNSKSRNANCDDMDLNKAGEGNTISKGVLRSCTKGDNMGSSPADKGISAEKSRLLDTNIALGLGDIHEGTPNRNMKGRSKKKINNSKSRNTNCDDMDLNQAGEGSTISKGVLRSCTKGENMGSSPADKGISDEKSRPFDTNIALVGKSDFVAGVGDIREGTPNRNRKAMSKKTRKNSESRNANCDDMDLNKAGEGSTITKGVFRSCTKGDNMGSSPADKAISAEKNRLVDTNTALSIDDIRVVTPNKNRKGISKARNTNSDDMDLNQAGEGITISKRVLRSSTRLSSANKNLQEDTLNKKGKKLMTKSRVKKYDDEYSSPAAKQNDGLHAEDRQTVPHGVEITSNPISKRVLRSSTSLSDANNLREDNLNKKRKKVMTKSRVTNCDDKYSTPAAKQSDGFHTEDRQKSHNGVKKTRKKLEFVRTPPPAHEGSPFSPQVSSLKKSRSGRKLLPSLEFWRNQTAVYDLENELTCIKPPTANANMSTD